ncbi:SRPBCC family protein [Burkholderia sp. 22PA0099]|uniref:SRPBCC family protein n=1 Tax=unclassified Burkholderia TaxID=2613784 RepID=UPI0039C4CAF8
MISRLTFRMPATSAEVFEAFHNHDTRLRWDTLLKTAGVEGGHRYPHVGAISVNVGRGWKSLFCLRTRFVSYQPPLLAAATLVAPAGIFRTWTASIRHRDLGGGQSDLIYTVRFSLRPNWLDRHGKPIVVRLFEDETRRRFEALAAFLRT